MLKLLQALLDIVSAFKGTYARRLTRRTVYRGTGQAGTVWRNARAASQGTSAQRFVRRKGYRTLRRFLR